MKTNWGWMRRGMELLGAACLGMMVWMSVGCRTRQTPSPEGPKLGPKLRATLYGHTRTVLSVAYSPDGKTLASGSADGTIKLWDVATDKQADK